MEMKPMELPPVLGYKELQHYFKFSRSMVYDLLRRPDVGAFTINSRRFIVTEVFLEWMKNQVAKCQKTKEECMIIPPKSYVDHIRSKYKVGSRVMLVCMNDPFTKLAPGEKGTITSVDDIGTVHIAWDCGSSLGCVIGEDQIEVIE